MKRILLAGAGHAHLHVAARTRRLREAGLAVCLIDPGHFWYSGRATGMLGGRFHPAQDRIDPRPVVEAAGGQFIAGRVRHVQRDERRVQLEDGTTLDYDWLSLNVGSIVRRDTIPGCSADPHCWTVKPIDTLISLRERLWRTLLARKPTRVAVVGGGPTGCEIAANLAALARRADMTIPIHLLQRSATLAPSLPRGARRRLGRTLGRLGVAVHCAAPVAERRDRTLLLADGEAIAADHVVLANGLSAPGWLDELGLSFDDGLVVDETLRSIDDERIFAVGDCAKLSAHALPRLGVFGVRQAPVLLDNLVAAAHGLRPRRYVPQSRWLSILDLGDGTALAARGPLWWHGRSSRWLKHRLDRRFLAQYHGGHAGDGGAAR